MVNSRFQLVQEHFEPNLGVALGQLQQLEIADSALIYGSPGSGKTSAVVSLATRLMAAHQPDAVLVIAANRSSANQLRDRLALSLQGSSFGPLAKTLSSFAFELLSQTVGVNSAQVPVLMTGAEQERLIAEIIDNHEIPWPNFVTPLVKSLSSFRSQMRELITQCIELEISPEQLSRRAKDQQNELWFGAAAVYELYLQGIPQSSLDPAELLVRAAKLVVAGGQFLPQLLIVDDAQELTPAGQKLVRAIAKHSALVLVGDPDASTQGFRFSDPLAMTKLMREEKPKHLLISLQPIQRPAALSNALAKISGQMSSALAGKQRKGLRLNPEENDHSVTVRRFATEQDESAFLATEIKRLRLIGGFSYSKIAVVARTRDALSKLASALSNQDIPVNVVGAGNALGREFASKSLLQLAQESLRPSAEKNIDAIFNNPFSGFDALELRRLKRDLMLEDDSDLSTLVNSPEKFENSKSSLVRRGVAFAKRLNQAYRLGSEPASVEQLLFCLWSGSGPETNWVVQSSSNSELAAQANENLNSIVALFAAANRFAERYPALTSEQFVSEQLRLSVPEDSLSAKSALIEAVTLATPAGLIGHSFDVVFLPGLIEGVWPNLKQRNSLFQISKLDSTSGEEKNSVLVDELRMFYKAAGAAKSHLILSAAESDSDQISQFARLCSGQIPDVQRFENPEFNLRILVGKTRRHLVTAEGNSLVSSALTLAKLANHRVPGAHPDSWYGLLDISGSSDTEPLVLSPSQLENFEKCPLHWFLSVAGAEQKNNAATLGTILHEIFESERFHSGSSSDVEAYLQELENKWPRLEFESDWLAAREKRKAQQAVINVVSYLQKFNLAEGRVIGREVPFEIAVENSKLRGKVDRIELWPDGKIIIADLKTSKYLPSVVDVVEHTQLAAYQLALELGAFDELLSSHEINWNSAGAKIIGVGAEKLSEREQPSISVNQNAAEKIRNLILNMQSLQLNKVGAITANALSHCTNDHEFGSCKIHLVPAVSYVE